MDLDWPELPFDAWRDTHGTLHLWLLILTGAFLSLVIAAPWATRLFLSPCTS